MKKAGIFSKNADLFSLYRSLVLQKSLLPDILLPYNSFSESFYESSGQ